MCARPSASEAGEGSGRWVRYVSAFGLYGVLLADGASYCSLLSNPSSLVLHGL